MKIYNEDIKYMVKKSIKEISNKLSKFKVYLMVGIPGSGKSTWCKNNHPELPIISRDLIRAELGYTNGVDEKAVLTPQQENEVTNVEYNKIKDYCKNRQSFIIDDTNTGRYRKQLIDFLHKYNAYIIGVNIDTPLEICIQRRKSQIPADVMQRIYQKKVDLRPNEVDEIINVK